MPIYDYQCPHCHAIYEDMWAKIDDIMTCYMCGNIMERIFLKPTNFIMDIEPYMDENIGHEPTLVKSKRHKKQLLKERGLSEIG